jgi:hypothetical protein
MCWRRDGRGAGCSIVPANHKIGRLSDNDNDNNADDDLYIVDNRSILIYCRYTRYVYSIEYVVKMALTSNFIFTSCTLLHCLIFLTH